MPMLFIHGERDTYIPLEQAQVLYRLARGPKSLWVVPGARHNQSIHQQPESYERRLVAFFDEHLGGAATSESMTGSVMSELAQPLAEGGSEAPELQRATATGAGRGA
jgi:hypothetical protein